MVTHGFAVAEAGPEGRVAYFLLDEPNLYYADPFGVVFSPDGGRLYVSSSGVDTVSVIDSRDCTSCWICRAARSACRMPPSPPTRAIWVSALNTSSRGSPRSRIPRTLRFRPTAAACTSPTGSRIPSRSSTPRRTRRPAFIDLGGPESETELRRGDRLFNYSSISFQKQLSCNTCHPEYHLDGLQYDIVAPEEGIGRELVDNRTMRGIAETGPYKWSGKNPSIAAPGRAARGPAVFPFPRL